MNERERLQRIMDILTDSAFGMCYCHRFVGDGEGPYHAEIKQVAKEITAIFKQPQKDTRSRREKLLDAQFVNIGVKPHVYHFTKRALLRGAFNAITIATIELKYKSIYTCIEKNTRLKIIEQATHLIEEFNKMDVYGIAICDRRDHFNKRYGRMKAKGQLIQHLLKEREE